MTEYLILSGYIALGIFGAYSHYLKKRYKTKDAQCSFLEYVTGEPGSTITALLGLIGAEYTILLAADTEHWFALRTVAEAIGAGYIADSGLNKAPQSED